MKKLTITFDNGPDPACTPEVLDVLAEHDARATFFVCGHGNSMHPAMQASANMDILYRAVNEGHWVGNHSTSHAIELGTTLDEDLIRREIDTTEEILGNLNEHRLFRPYMGGGVRSKRTLSPPAVKHLCKNNYTMVLFNCLPRDWEAPEDWPEAALSTMKEQDWSLLCIHDVASYGSYKQLDRFLDRVQKRGVEITQSFPRDCTPIIKGEIVGSLDDLVCGATPEPATKVAQRAAELVNAP